MPLYECALCEHVHTCVGMPECIAAYACVSVQVYVSMHVCVHRAPTLVACHKALPLVASNKHCFESVFSFPSTPCCDSLWLGHFCALVALEVMFTSPWQGLEAGFGVVFPTLLTQWAEAPVVCVSSWPQTSGPRQLVLRRPNTLMSCLCGIFTQETIILLQAGGG